MTEQKQKRKPRKYTDEFKKQLVDLYHSGKRRCDICREYDIATSLFDKWVKQEEYSGSFHEKDNRTPEQQELIRLRKENQLAGMISCEIKYNTFQSVSHQTTLSIPTDSTTLIYETACHLFKELWNGTPIRLLGVRTSKLCDPSEPVQLSLFDILLPETSSSQTNLPPAGNLKKEKQEKLDKALDSIKNRYGKDAVVRGSLLNIKNTK